jgi:hypothetical protein
MGRESHLKKLIAKTAIQLSESFEIDGRENVYARAHHRPGGRGLQGPRLHKLTVQGVHS